LAEDISKSQEHVFAELGVVSIQTNAFLLRFKSTLTLHDGSFKHKLNLRGNLRTYFGRIGDELDGFKLLKFEPKFEQREIHGVRGRVELVEVPGEPGHKISKLVKGTQMERSTHRIDVSVLTLKRGDRIIPLVKGMNVRYSEYVVTLLFQPHTLEFVLKIGEEFDIRGRKYRVIAIDARKKTCVIADIETKERFTISQKKKRAQPRDQLEKQ